MTLQSTSIAAALLLSLGVVSAAHAQDLRAAPGESLPAAIGTVPAPPPPAAGTPPVAAAPLGTPAIVAAEQAASNPNPVTSDNQIWWRIQPLSHEPGLNSSTNPKKAVDITKDLIHFEHTDTGGYIYNSLTATVLISNGHDLANGGGSGAQELYATYRGDISAVNFGYKPLSFPGVVDTQFEFGVDFNSKNTTFAPGRIFMLVGPNFVLDLPGSVNLAVHFAKEVNHDGYTGKTDNFQPTVNTEFSYTEPLDFTGLPLRLEGAYNNTFYKGRVSGGKSANEFYTYNSLILDAGQLAQWKPHVIDVFAGVQFWVNKFGIPQKNNGGAQETAPYFGVAVHF